MLNGNFLSFVSYLHHKKYEHFTLVRDTETGKVVTAGDSDMAFEYLSGLKTAQRRESGDLLPEKSFEEPKKPLKVLLYDTKEVRQFASSLMQYFLAPKQRLGQV